MTWDARERNWKYYHGMFLEELRKTMNTSDMTAGLFAEILTWASRG
jgi:hypothetical protein